MFRRLILLMLFLSLALWLAGCGPGTPATKSVPPGKQSGKSSELTPPAQQARPANESDVKIANFAFAPQELKIKAGTKVVWTNKDDAPHLVHGDNDEFKSDTLSNGGSFEQTFSGPGTITYHCHLHRNMKGRIIVE